MPVNSIGQAFRNAANKLKITAYNSVLVSSANAIAKDARANASWSSTIPGAIEVGESQFKDFVGFITVKVDGDKAPSATAFEFGSGEHRTKGNPERYPIRAKEDGGYLAFHWENEPPEMANAPHLPDGRILLREVMHPGVEPIPFLAPAVLKNLGFIRRKILGITAKELRDSLGVDVIYATK